MTARFPQSSSPLSWRIKPEFASKIFVVYWSAGADSLHRLRAADTTTTLITRASSGCTFNADYGTIEGSSTTTFTDAIAGGYGALTEASDFSFGASWYGDIHNGVGDVTVGIGSTTPPDVFDNGFKVFAQNYGFSASVKGWRLDGLSVPGAGNDVQGWMNIALRTAQSDAIAKQRQWGNGAETVAARANRTSTGTDLLGATARPLYLGQSRIGSGGSKASFEFAFLGTSDMTDADMVAITTDPSVLIEEVSASTDATAPGATLTGTATLEPGSASDGATVSATAPGATLTGTATLTPGTASGTTSGSFTSDVIGNNTTSILADTAVIWTWWQGSIGATPTSLTHGTGTTDASGVLTVTGLPVGTGFLIVRTTDSTGVYYQPGTVS